MPLQNLNIDSENLKYYLTYKEYNILLLAVQSLIDDYKTKLETGFPGGGGGGGGTDIAVLKALFLSKIAEDSAKEKITFEKGLNAEGLARMVDTYFGNFSSGIHTGTGGAITKEGHGELESLIVRTFLEVPELRYNKLSLIGEEIAIGAGGIIEEVSPILGGYRIKLKLEEGELNPFWYDDIIKGIYHHDNGFQTTFARVTSPTDANNPYLNIVLRPSTGSITYPAPVPFMHIARWGNFDSNPIVDASDRQSLLILSAKTGSITFYEGMKDYSGGYINSKWGKPVGLEFIPNIENLGLDPNDPLLYLKTLLVQDIIRVDHQGEPMVEYRDRGLWDLAIASGDNPYRSLPSLKDDVWHNKVKYRCLVDKTLEEPTENSPFWLYLYKLEDGISAIDVSFSNPYVILKALQNDTIESYLPSIANLKVLEGGLELEPLLIGDTQTDASFWIHSLIGTDITPGIVSKDTNTQSLNISAASEILEDKASIRIEIRGKRYNGEDFTRIIVQRFLLVQDGKGLQVNIKGSKNTLAEIQNIINPIPGDAWVNSENGHIYIWDGSTWNDSGEFKGDPGENAIIHFAYADIVLVDGQGEQYVPANGGFTLDDYADKKWLGFYWDYNSNDSLNSRDYNWIEVKGKKGDKGADGTSVSIKGKVDNPSLLPNISNTLGDGYISENSGSLWIYDGVTQETYLDETQTSQNAVFGWLNAGQIQGESNYIHIAWADDITFTGGGLFQSATGFTTTDGNKKRWYGIYVDNIKQDADIEDADKYNWVDTKGEAGKDSHSDEFIYIRNNDANFGVAGNTPGSNNTIDYVPPGGWTDDPVGVTSSLKYEWVCTRKFRDEVWGSFSIPSIWNIYVTNGEDGKDSKSDEYVFCRTANPNFGIADNRPPSPQQDDYVPGLPLWTKAGTWSDNPTGVTESQQYEFVSKRVYRNDSWSAFSIPSLWAKWSADGKSPYVGPNGNWFIWNYATQSFIDSGDPSQGDDGNAPRIHPTGYWEVWGDLGDGTFGYILTSFRARGIDGKDSKAEEFIFIRNNNSNYTTIPPTSQTDDYIPPGGWTDNPLGVNANYTYEWVSVRKYRDSTWQAFSAPSIWNMYVHDGEDGKDSKSDEFIFTRNNNPNFGVVGNRPPSTQVDDYKPTGWSDNPLGVSPSYLYEWVSKRVFRNNSWSAFSIPSLWANYSKDGVDGLDGDVLAMVPYMAGEWEGEMIWLDIGGNPIPPEAMTEDINGNPIPINPSGAEYVMRSTRIYFRDTSAYPIVSYLKGPDGKPLYYYLNQTRLLPIGSLPPNQSSYWKRAEGYEVIIAEAIFSGLIQMKNADGLVTAGLNGARGEENQLPSIWSGGDLEEAKRFRALLNALKDNTTLPTSKIANFVVNHDGSVKIGKFIINLDGSINVIDPITGKIVTTIDDTNITSVEDIVSNIPLSIDKNIPDLSVTATAISGENKLEISGHSSSIIIPRNGGDLTITGLFVASLNIPNLNDGRLTTVGATVSIYRNGLLYSGMTGDGYSTRNGGSGVYSSVNFSSNSGNSPYIVHNVPAGTYTLRVTANISRAGGTGIHPCTSTGEFKGGKFAWNYAATPVQRLHIGKDGIAGVYGTKYFHFGPEGTRVSEGGFFMGSGNVSVGGVLSQAIGKFSSGFGTESQGDGVYRINHNIGHTNYDVRIVANSNSEFNGTIFDKGTNYIMVQMKQYSSNIDASFEFFIYSK